MKGLLLLNAWKGDTFQETTGSNCRVTPAVTAAFGVAETNIFVPCIAATAKEYRCLCDAGFAKQRMAYLF
jgi:hypothetical protein